MTSWLDHFFSIAHDPGATRWRLEFRHMGSPGVRLLRSSEGDPAGALPFALCAHPGWGNRVYASAKRDAAVKHLVATASKKLGISVAGELCFKDPRAVNHCDAFQRISPITLLLFSSCACSAPCMCEGSAAEMSCQIRLHDLASMTKQTYHVSRPPFAFRSVFGFCYCFAFLLLPLVFITFS